MNRQLETTSPREKRRKLPPVRRRPRNHSRHLPAPSRHRASASYPRDHHHLRRSVPLPRAADSVLLLAHHYHLSPHRRLHPSLSLPQPQPQPQQQLLSCHSAVVVVFHRLPACRSLQTDLAAQPAAAVALVLRSAPSRSRASQPRGLSPSRARSQPSRLARQGAMPRTMRTRTTMEKTRYRKRQSGQRHQRRTRMTRGRRNCKKVSFSEGFQALVSHSY